MALEKCWSIRRPISKISWNLGRTFRQIWRRIKEVVSLLASNKWPFRIHATYDESISRILNVFEEVNRDIPFKTDWFFDHCETISDRSLDRVKALGGGIAIQNRMESHGEYFLDRYGKAATDRTPPIRKMLERGIPVGAGTGGTRVASYNPGPVSIGSWPEKQ
jgi:predicted amidohydrolase YtcJ